MSTRKIKKTPVEAITLMKYLAGCPDYCSRRERAEANRRAQLLELKERAAPVIQDLRENGYNVDSIDELRRAGISYRSAVPILIRWLPNIAHPGVKESIVRALSVPWAKGVASKALLEEFRSLPTEQEYFCLKWAIGNALSVVATDAVFDELVELVRDKRHGRAREMLAVALGNMKNPAAVDVLIELLGDEEVAGHAIMALGKLKAEKARPYIERFLDHPKAWVRREAKKALAKLDKAQARRSGGK